MMNWLITLVEIILYKGADNYFLYPSCELEQQFDKASPISDQSCNSQRMIERNLGCDVFYDG